MSPASSAVRCAALSSSNFARSSAQLNALSARRNGLPPGSNYMEQPQDQHERERHTQQSHDPARPHRLRRRARDRDAPPHAEVVAADAHLAASSGKPGHAEPGRLPLVAAPAHPLHDRERHGEAIYRFKDGMLPSDFFRRNVVLSFQEDAIGVRLRDVIGVDNMMWGSDYPHSESTFPQSRKILAEILAGVPGDEQAKIAGGNTAHVYHFDVAGLTVSA